MKVLVATRKLAIRGADDDRGLHAHGRGGGSEELGKLLDDNDPAASQCKKRGGDVGGAAGGVNFGGGGARPQGRGRASVTVHASVLVKKMRFQLMEEGYLRGREMRMAPAEVDGVCGGGGWVQCLDGGGRRLKGHTGSVTAIAQCEARF